jgi:N-acetyl-1-D-myo-inositol-2-amino-2-deoxy-alpha-D-glucopyranoside deacetylase
VRPRRLLFVHAHPDDESLATGLAMAHHVAAGDEVHLLTCTLGEEGEVIPPELRHLAADREDRLGPHRRGELRAAMAELGVRHRVLGEDEASGRLSRWRDSGMAGTPSAERPDAFARADVDEVAALVRAAVREVGPDVVVTYDREGGYRHPDHVQTHRVTCAALAGLDDPPPLFAVLTPRSWAEEDRAWLAEHTDPATGWTVPAPDDPFPPNVRPDGEVTHEVVDPGARAAQQAALRHHRTQVTLADGYYALSNDISARLAGREGFARLDPSTGRTLAGPGGPRRALVGGNG